MTLKLVLNRFIMPFAVFLLPFACDDTPAASQDQESAAGCYSPSQNLDSAYSQGAQGCACNPEQDKDVCLPDSTGRRVALVCSDTGVWTAVEDGPCAPGPRP